MARTQHILNKHELTLFNCHSEPEHICLSECCTTEFTQTVRRKGILVLDYPSL